VIVERLRTEATVWVNAVALQAGRLDRRHRKTHLDAVELQVMEVDLHLFLVALFRLRRCVGRVGMRVPSLRMTVDARVATFNEAVPSLTRLRHVSEHIDEYNLDEGRDASVSRSQVQRWHLDKNVEGGLVWGWLEERLDVQRADHAAIALYRGFVADCNAWIEKNRSG
jgi:hypothetical protein